MFGMIELSEQPRLVQQLAEVEVLPVRDLDRDLLVDPGVFREIDAAEAAAAERRKDAVLPDGLAAKEHLADEYTLRVRPRFHVPAINSTLGDASSCREEEAEHLVRVLRLGVGDEVDIFDGRGEEYWRAEIVQSTARSRAAVRRGSSRARRRPTVDSDHARRQPMLKGDKIDAVVRDAVMLGVTAIRPVVSERIGHQPWRRCGAKRAHRRDGSASRWRRRSSAGRAVVPIVHDADRRSTWHCTDE